MTVTSARLGGALLADWQRPEPLAVDTDGAARRPPDSLKVLELTPR